MIPSFVPLTCLYEHGHSHTSAHFVARILAQDNNLLIVIRIPHANIIHTRHVYCYIHTTCSLSHTHDMFTVTYTRHVYCHIHTTCLLSHTHDMTLSHRHDIHAVIHTCQQTSSQNAHIESIYTYIHTYIYIYEHIYVYNALFCLLVISVDPVRDMDTKRPGHNAFFSFFKTSALIPCATWTSSTWS